MLFSVDCACARMYFRCGFPTILRSGIVLGFLSLMPALAQPPIGADPNSPMGLWYKSLRDGVGRACCTIADCRPVDARLNQGHWEVMMEDGWRRVWRGNVLQRENPDGRPI